MAPIAKLARSALVLIVLGVLWKFDYFDKIAKKISQVVDYLHKKHIIPNFIYTNGQKLSSIEGVAIATVLNNLCLNLLLFLLYELTRPLSRSVWGDHKAIAMKHGAWVWEIEGLCGIAYEPWIQNLWNYNLDTDKGDDGLHGLTWEQNVFGAIYWKGHNYVTGLVYYTVFFCASRKYNRYQLYMVLFWYGSFIAIIIYTCFPCAPPRYLPDAHIDDMLKGVWKRGVCDEDNDNGWGNCYAAMPSVHSLWCTLSCFAAIWHFYLLFSFSKSQSLSQPQSKLNVYVNSNEKQQTMIVSRKLGQFIGIVGILFFIGYFITMHMVIFATGNHWILDAVASWVIAIVVYCAWRLDLLPYLQNFKNYNINDNGTNNTNNRLKLDIKNGNKLRISVEPDLESQPINNNDYIPVKSQEF